MAGVASDSGITMIDGNEKPAKDIRPGDDVIAYDFENKRIMFARVEKIETTEGAGLEIATAEASVIVSPGHGLFVSNGVQKQAMDLNVGDEVLRSDFFDGKKEKITVKRPVEKAAFYDFAVPDYGNFVANGFIVKGIENCCLAANS